MIMNHVLSHRHRVPVCFCVFALLVALPFFVCVPGMSAEDHEVLETPIMVVGLVADNHYDTFPAGEKAPWQPMDSWLIGQQQRTSTPLKRRYDIAKDKMLEAVDVFNRVPNMTFAVNLGDLINNDVMWNLKPILDAFNQIRAPKFSIVGNHDRRAHNDRFGKNNATQERWLMRKLGLLSHPKSAGTKSDGGKGRRKEEKEQHEQEEGEWFYSVDYPPFLNVFLDSMVMEEPESNPKRRLQLAWLKGVLDKARSLNRVVLLFGHISIGLATSPFAPLLKSYEHIIGGFFGHTHKGGYILQGKQFHTTIIQGQIETLTNAYAVLEVFADRMELTGFGRVPTRIMKFDPATASLLRSQLQRLVHVRSSSSSSSSSSSAVVVVTDIPVGGLHQPAPPAQLWPASEPLQPVPPLHLNLPAYKKPQIPAAEPNPGETRFFRHIYSSKTRWQKRPPKTLAPEDPVDLTSYLKNKRTWIKIENGKQILMSMMNRKSGGEEGVGRGSLVVGASPSSQDAAAAADGSLHGDGHDQKQQKQSRGADGADDGDDVKKISTKKQADDAHRGEEEIGSYIFFNVLFGVASIVLVLLLLRCVRSTAPPPAALPSSSTSTLQKY